MKLSKDKMIIVALILVILYLLYRPRIEGFSNIDEVNKTLEDEFSKAFGPPPDGVGDPSEKILKNYQADLNKSRTELMDREAQYKKDLNILEAQYKKDLNILEAQYKKDLKLEEANHVSKLKDIVSEVKNIVQKMKTDVIKESKKSDKLPVEITRDPELDPRLKPFDTNNNNKLDPDESEALQTLVKAYNA